MLRPVRPSTKSVQARSEAHPAPAKSGRCLHAHATARQPPNRCNTNRSRVVYRDITFTNTESPSPRTHNVSSTATTSSAPAACSCLAASARRASCASSTRACVSSVPWASTWRAARTISLDRSRQSCARRAGQSECTHSGGGRPLSGRDARLPSTRLVVSDAPADGRSTRLSAVQAAARSEPRGRRAANGQTTCVCSGTPRLPIATRASRDTGQDAAALGEGHGAHCRRAPRN